MSQAKRRSVLTVNGEQHHVLAPAAATLLDVLRTGLGLTGSKCGCNHGVCGACTVLLDGKLARSCLTLAADVGERRVTTIEGIAGDLDFSAVQRALVESGAIQCGFCTPGFVITLTELFARDPHPGRETIRAALSGNLCRCSGYVKIVEAAEHLAGGVR
ncbi:MAG: (2Fe-2S)-binding protein [Betaproteobacteria bacterium]|nr:(2Fe-2S)-binding protein [Betaproteobacteria bacterium]